MTQNKKAQLPLNWQAVLSAYDATRRMTHKLIEPLSAEDMVVQAMPDASPAKWHIAHTSWFFEEFLLVPFIAQYERLHPDYAFFYNSYYNTVGDMWARPIRGLQTRPTLNEVLTYREHINEKMSQLLTQCEQGQFDEKTADDIMQRVWLGIHHEQQHQELLLMDILSLFAHNPLHPTYRPAKPAVVRPHEKMTWQTFPEGLHHIGADISTFHYDHEAPRHKCHVNAFRLATRPVTNGEFLEFIEDGGYESHALWLSDGWDEVCKNNWRAPLYWQKDRTDAWCAMTLHGLVPLNHSAPLVHVSYYEACAYAQWADARLPTETEWEIASHDAKMTGFFMEDECFYPQAMPSSQEGLQAMFGTVWEWTQSAFLPYHGYKAPAGAIGEYNGKFMSGQMVMRGGSFATPQDHMRPSYRNFFYPAMRWQFGGIRLAQDNIS